MEGGGLGRGAMTYRFFLLIEGMELVKHGGFHRIEI